MGKFFTQITLRKRNNPSKIPKVAKKKFSKQQSTYLLHLDKQQEQHLN